MLAPTVSKAGDNKRVLVTGATGFLGRRVVASLAAMGYEVHGVDIRPATVVPSGVSLHVANLLDQAETAALLATVRPTHLLHFAWYAVPGKYWRSIENFRWLEASLQLMRSFHECGGQRIVMAGSCAEYDWNYGYCSEDVTPCRPTTPYGVCKNALQESLKAYCAETGLSGAWGRLFFLYGPEENPSRLVPSVISSLMRGEQAKCSHGRQLRDFLHVDDVASAFAHLLGSFTTGAVNIASGTPVSLREVVLTAARLLAAPERVLFGAIAVPAEDPPLLVADNRRLLELGWHPRYDLYTGIADTVAWWRENGVL